MATLPIYDDTGLLPCLTFTFKSTHEESKRYLGNQALAGDMYAYINIKPKTDEEMEALYSFWKDDCNYGLEPFILKIPVFGFNRDGTMSAGYVVKFLEDLNSVNTTGEVWEIRNQKLKLFGRVVYITDDSGTVLFDDSSELIWADEETLVGNGTIQQIIRIRNA